MKNTVSLLPPPPNIIHLPTAEDSNSAIVASTMEIAIMTWNNMLRLNMIISAHTQSARSVSIQKNEQEIIFLTNTRLRGVKSLGAYKFESDQMYREEKESLILLFKEREKLLEDHKSELQVSFADILRKFEADMLESLNSEKEKITRMQQDHDKKELTLKSDHSEELKCANVQAEKEIKQKTMQLKIEYEGHLNSLRRNHEDQYRKLEEVLDAQKDKEEKQRALLQLQWKVMGDKPQEDQEVNSKKNYSKTRNHDASKTTQRAPVNVETEPEDSPYCPRESQTLVSNLMREVEKGKLGSLMSIPKHSGKVTHHIEVETGNGRTITKRKETKSTVMFGDPRKHQKRQTFKVNILSVVCKSIKGGIKGGKTNPSNIGDLFSEGSLNPYAI